MCNENARFAVKRCIPHVLLITVCTWSKICSAMKTLVKGLSEIVCCNIHIFLKSLIFPTCEWFSRRRYARQAIVIIFLKIDSCIACRIIRLNIILHKLYKTFWNRIVAACIKTKPSLSKRVWQLWIDQIHKCHCSLIKRIQYTSVNTSHRCHNTSFISMKSKHRQHLISNSCRTF